MSAAASHEELVARLLEAADVEPDAAFTRRFGFMKAMRGRLAVPRGLRELMLWDDARVYGVPGMSYAAGDGRVTLWWRQDVMPPGRAAAVRKELSDRMRRNGFALTAGAPQSHIKEAYERLRSPISNREDALIFRRRKAEVLVEVVVSGLSGGLVGGSPRYDARLDVVWAVSVETDLPAVTFGRLLASCQALRPLGLERQIAAPVRDAPVSFYLVSFDLRDMQSSWAVTIPVEYRRPLEGTLERLGFRQSHVLDPPSPSQDHGDRKTTWERWSDHTYVHFRNSPGAATVTFACQAPQLDTRSLKPAPLDSFDFSSNPNVGRYLRAWDRIARRLAGPRWEHIPWRGDPTADRPHFSTAWRLRDGRGRWLQHISASAVSDGHDPFGIGSIKMGAASRPAGAGWSARVSVQSSPFCTVADEFLPSIGFEYYAAGNTRNPASLFGYFPGLIQYHDETQFDGTHYRVGVMVETGCASLRELARWMESPETLRDTGLAWLDRVESEFEKGIRSGEAVERAWVEIESESVSLLPASPALWVCGPPAGLSPQSLLVETAAPDPHLHEPRETRPSDRKLTESEQDEIIQKARSQIEANRRRLREHYREMHGALMKAFPFDEFWRSLEIKGGDRPEKPERRAGAK
ncbi:MAG: hypothetical protein KY476_10475 [Planctomycetes bacterium]|nr:hypothetical protein [Planctomycetota bacterium]